MSHRFEVVLDDGAEADLESIVDYLTEHRGCDDALALLDMVTERVATLGSFPLRGPVPKELEGSGETDVRQSVLGRHRIFYFVDGDVVTVFLIADGRRDIETLLASRLLGSRPHP